MIYYINQKEVYKHEFSMSVEKEVHNLIGWPDEKITELVISHFEKTYEERLFGNNVYMVLVHPIKVVQVPVYIKQQEFNFPGCFVGCNGNQCTYCPFYSQSVAVTTCSDGEPITISAINTLPSKHVTAYSSDPFDAFIAKNKPTQEK